MFQSINPPNPAPPVTPRTWKFWRRVLIGLFWCAFLALVTLYNTQSPSMSRWWAEKIKSEKKTREAHARKNNLPIPYTKTGDYYQLTFDILSSFPSVIPSIEPTGHEGSLGNTPSNKKSDATQVPSSIAALDGAKITVVGFMIPMISDKGQVSSFILAQNQGTCCYGIVPKLNQWIYVEMNPGKMVDSIMDIPLTVYGTLSVNSNPAAQDKNWCLYRMAGDKVDLPQRFSF